MKLKAKLNTKFYIVTVLLLGIVILGWYGVYFLNANTILTENDVPISNECKFIFSILFGTIIFSWTLSLFALIRQSVLGCAFEMDDTGIHLTSTATILLAFVLVSPIKEIPYSAIKKIENENAVFTVYIDKSKIKANSILKLFVRTKYHFFKGFTTATEIEIKEVLRSYLKF